MRKILLVNGHLIFPPSSTSCFRDITLYASVFRDAEVVLQIEETYTDTCYQYLKQHGAFDFVEDIVKPEQETGIILSSDEPYHIRARKLWQGNLSRIVSDIDRYYL